jgi:hypothetical protein
MNFNDATFIVVANKVLKKRGNSSRTLWILLLEQESGHLFYYATTYLERKISTLMEEFPNRLARSKMTNTHYSELVKGSRLVGTYGRVTSTKSGNKGKFPRIRIEGCKDYFKK